MARANTTSRIYEGSETKVQCIRYTKINPGLIITGRIKELHYGYGFVGHQVKRKTQEGKKVMSAYKRIF